MISVSRTSTGTWSGASYLKCPVCTKDVIVKGGYQKDAHYTCANCALELVFNIWSEAKEASQYKASLCAIN
jgi:transposase-like protein